MPTTTDDDDEDDEDKDQNVVDELARLTRGININRPECASNKVAEEKEQMMLEAAEHIKMARAQRQLYQDKVDKARQTVEKIHSGTDVHFCCRLRAEYGAACIQF
jgi:predicted small metal-binding protein